MRLPATESWRASAGEMARVELDNVANRQRDPLTGYFILSCLAHTCGVPRDVAPPPAPGITAKGGERRPRKGERNAR
jgi:hypothetical protein